MGISAVQRAPALTVVAPVKPVVVDSSLVQAQRTELTVKRLMTNEKGWFGRIVEYIRFCFGSITPGSYTSLQRSVQLVVRDVLAKAPTAASTANLKHVVALRADKLKLDRTMADVYARRILELTLATVKKPVDSTARAIALGQCYTAPEVAVESEVKPVRFWNNRNVQLAAATALTAAVLGGAAYWAGREIYAHTHSTSSVIDKVSEVASGATHGVKAVATAVASPFVSGANWFSNTLSSLWTSKEIPDVKFELNGGETNTQTDEALKLTNDGANVHTAQGSANIEKVNPEVNVHTEVVGGPGTLETHPENKP